MSLPDALQASWMIAQPRGCNSVGNGRKGPQNAPGGHLASNRLCPCCGGHLLPGWRVCGGCLDWARRMALRASIRAAVEVSPATDMQTEFRRLPENLT